MSASWTPTPEAIVGRLDPVDVERRWSRLHAGDALDRPTDAALLEGWTDYHNGHFQRARDAGLRAGSAGWSLAQKATCVYAVYVEPHESTRLILLSDVAEDRGQLIDNEYGNNPAGLPQRPATRRAFAEADWDLATMAPKVGWASLFARQP